MGSYHGPKVRLTRRAGVPVAMIPKHIKQEQPTRPGMHGKRRPRQSLYGKQLTEKQKLMAFYNIRNTQLRGYVQASAAEKRFTSEALMEILERRLDNVIRRVRWARTIWQAREMVSHGHFHVNGRKVDLPSFGVKPGDKITVKDRSKELIKRYATEAEGTGFETPAWLAIDPNTPAVSVVRLPAPEEIKYTFEIDLGKVIEFYTR